MRKRIRFRKKYTDSKRAYKTGQVGEFEGDFLTMLLKMKYAIEVDEDGYDLIKVAEYVKKKSKTKLTKEEKKNGSNNRNN